MNPDFQDVEVEVDPTQTFAGRLEGLEQLRSSGASPDLWRDKAIKDALDGGKYLERRFHDFTAAIIKKVSEAASSSVQAGLILDVDRLKTEAKRRERNIAIIAAICGTVVAGIILQLTEHLWK